MLDTIQAAVHLTNGFVYFFKGNHYVKWDPGTGVVTHNGGQVLRRLGMDGWRELPVEFHSGIDAAFYYRPEDAVYFFQGNHYVKWKDGGPVTQNGSPICTIGVDGWQGLPEKYRSGFDAVIYHEQNRHAYFFKHSTYVKYLPGVGVIPANGSEIREFGVSGWNGIPPGFQSGVDTAMYYRANHRIYFFKGRQYARWNAERGNEGLDDRYPRRIGLRNGLEIKTEDSTSGWPGLSHVISGPLIGHTTDRETRVWVWLSDKESAERIQLELNGLPASFTVVDPVSRGLKESVQAIHPGSVIRQFIVKGLSPGTSHHLDLLLDGAALESLRVRTPPSPSNCGDVRLAFLSCVRITKGNIAPAPVLQALSSAQAHLTLFCGDNCYYVDGAQTVDRCSPKEPIDWADTARMLRRQMQARNHPEMANLLLRGATFSTWDDHDFGFNDAPGADEPAAVDWVGRERSSQVFRAFWPNNYLLEEGDVRHAFRWGPVHVFMTDSRFERSDRQGRIWSAEQQSWLFNGMRESDAPLKLVVTSDQFLSHPSPERAEFFSRLDSIGGRILFLAGNVHYTSLFRPDEGNGTLMEFTSSPAKMHNTIENVDRDRIWGKKIDNFGLVRISIDGVIGSRVLGEVILEARDEHNQVIHDSLRNRPCRTTWNLDTGEIS
jgi:alkaline phosphatase D